MPEEINRVLTDRVSSILYCPTEAAVHNLQTEGFPFTDPERRKQEILNAGDVMYDATLYYQSKVSDTISLDTWGLEDKGYALCTLHRAENTDDMTRLDAILAALREINGELQLVLPLHPRTRNLLGRQGKLELLEGLLLLEPLPYLEMQRLEMGAEVILTDSGGIQKEAYFHGVPCITLRDETEWVETVEAGWNRVVGAEPEKILSAFRRRQIPGGKQAHPYGTGNAAKHIVDHLWNSQ